MNYLWYGSSTIFIGYRYVSQYICSVRNTPDATKYFEKLSFKNNLFYEKKAMLARPCTFRACFPKTYYLRQWRRSSNNKHKNVHFYRMENYGVEGNILAYSHYLVADEKLQGILFRKKWEKDHILYAGFFII